MSHLICYLFYCYTYKLKQPRIDRRKLQVGIKRTETFLKFPPWEFFLSQLFNILSKGWKKRNFKNFMLWQVNSVWFFCFFNLMTSSYNCDVMLYPGLAAYPGPDVGEGEVTGGSHHLAGRQEDHPVSRGLWKALYFYECYWYYIVEFLMYH